MKDVTKGVLAKTQQKYCGQVVSSFVPMERITNYDFEKMRIIIVYLQFENIHLANTFIAVLPNIRKDFVYTDFK